jgi:HEAT repeat protein
MGLFDFFSGNKDPQKAIDKIRRRLVDQYRQTHERYECMDDLAKIGTPAALEALLERFTMQATGSTVDEEEKNYCAEKINAWGEAAVEPLRKFIATHEAVYFPLKALREVAGDEVAVETLLEAIRSCDPGYHEGLDRLREIVSNLRDFQHERVFAALVGLLASRSNEIRFYALDGLVGYPPEQVAEHFAARILDPDESQRVKSLAWELGAEHSLPMAPWAAQLGPIVPRGYRLDEQGHLTRGGPGA